MHGQDPAEFLRSISTFLGSYYLFIAVMNGFAAYWVWHEHETRPLVRVGFLAVTRSGALLAAAMFFTVLAALSFSGGEAMMTAVSVPEPVRDAADAFMNPMVYTVGILVILSLMFAFRQFFVQPAVAWTLLNLSLLLMGMSLTDPNFAAIVTKADNVPIVGMIYLLGFFTWLGAYKAVQNDERAKRGLEPLEKLDNQKILVWPDLVYTELICMVGITALLLVWAIMLQAPLEEPASAVKTPNPSKAPWYFLGLQEMLVYYDPWMAGVVLPSVVVAGLMAIPYIDFNKKGNGYYTIEERKFAYLTFQFGFLVLWVTLIVMGTFLRGPNWNFFGFYEYWDAHKVEALNNVDLSEYFWNVGLRTARPRAPDGSGTFTTISYILLREAPGIILVILYFAAIPPAMVLYSRFFRGLYLRMGFIRFMVLANLLQMMMLLPLKMVMRWSFNMKYFIAIPEYFLNF